MAKEIKIVVVGNGFGGTYTLRNLHKYFHKHTRTSLTLVGEKNYFLFTPLLHEVATGSISPENIIEPIRKVLGCCLDRFYLGKVDKINTASKTLQIGKDIVPYDYLVLAQGSQTNFYNIPGAEENSFSLKSLESAIKIKNHLITQMEKASRTEDDRERRRLLSFVVVGGGPSGVEVATEIHELVVSTFTKYYTHTLIDDVSVTLVQRDPELLPQFGPKIRQKSLKVLTKKKIKVMLLAEVVKVGPSQISLKSGENIDTETIIWVAGIKPNIIPFDITPSTTPDGRLVTDEYLRLQNMENIFAIGDTSAVKNKDGRYLPALAQVAEKESVVIAKNLYRSINNQPLKSFQYKSAGNLVSLGQWMAAGEIAHFTFTGHITWWLWRTVYLSKMISFKKKLRVAMDWTINIFSPRDISQI